MACILYHGTALKCLTGQLHAVTPPPPGWVGPRAGLDAFLMTDIPARIAVGSFDCTGPTICDIHDRKSSSDIK